MAVAQRNVRSSEASKHTPTPFAAFPSSHPTLSQAVDRTVRFKKGLLATLNQEVQLFDHISQLQRYQVYLGHVNGTHFTIEISDLVLEHMGKDLCQSCYIQIHSEKESTAQHDLFRSNLPKHVSAPDTTADLFLPLGWLVEHGKNAKYCPTRYVCLLNISTMPMSLWLMYDYVDIDKEIEFKNTMVVYDDMRHGEATPKLTKAKDLFQGKDLILLYRDVAQWDPNSHTYQFANASLNYSLGASTRIVTCTPPKRLLDAITQA
ncbi:MAG: hypothetical protein Q9207_002977 [Kuettlingeria erythrocarpa]